MSPFLTRETVAAGLHCPAAVRRIWASLGQGLGCIIRGPDLQITFPLCIYNTIKSTELKQAGGYLQAVCVPSPVVNLDTIASIHPFSSRSPLAPAHVFLWLRARGGAAQRGGKIAML